MVRDEYALRRRLSPRRPCAAVSGQLQRVQAALLVVALGLGAGAGCGGAAVPLDENAARQALAQSLDVWAAGGRAADLRSRSPEIVVVDQDWSDGCRLIDYELVGVGLFDGKNLRAPVALTLQRPAGATSKVSASFIVGLDPVITVVRVME